MPTRPLLPSSDAAQASASAPSARSFSNSLKVPSDVPAPRTSWMATI